MRQSPSFSPIQAKDTFFLILLAVVCGIFWGSSLSFFPVPWPDDSAFFLTGIDWITWPPAYLMRSQAAFIPSYNDANFNTMPLLPLIMGIFNQMGINQSHSVRIFGIIGYFVFCALLYFWGKKRAIPVFWYWTIPLVALFSPMMRWGANLVRPEIWQGVIFLLLLMEIDGFFKRKNPWRLPAILAISAYIHFEGVYWVPAVAIGLFPFHEPLAITKKFRLWMSRLLRVAWRTLVLLSPWLVYVITHWGYFWEQMMIQFGRLDNYHHPYFNSVHGFFHSLFMHHGNPTSYPKFYNLGKVIVGIFWVFGLLRVIYLSLRYQANMGVRFAALAGALAALYLWVDKAEIWFIVLIHATFFPVLLLAVTRTDSSVDWDRPSSYGLKIAGQAAALLFVTLLGVQIGIAGNQWQVSRESYTWKNYRQWINCIDQKTHQAKHIWQPHLPDILVELAGRQPRRQYTRAVDFRNIDHLMGEFIQSVDAIVHTLHIDAKDVDQINSHRGELRDQDLYFLNEYPWLPHRQYSALALGEGWEISICQEGPFWAAISTRKAVQTVGLEASVKSR